MTMLTESQGYELLTPGIHLAICAEAVDLGEQDSPWGRKHRGVLLFQVNEIGSDGNPKEVRLYFSMTLGTASMPSKIRKVVRNWGVATDSDIAAGFSIDQLVGKQAKLIVTTGKNAKGQDVSQIDNVLPPDQGQNIQLRNYKPWAERQAQQQPPQPPQAGADAIRWPPGAQAAPPAGPGQPPGVPTGQPGTPAASPPPQQWQYPPEVTDDINF